MVFSIFNKYEQTSNKLHDSKQWNSLNQFMQKQLRLRWGPNIHDIFFNIFCLIFNWLCFLFMNTWDYFTHAIELILFPILALSSLSKYALHHPIFKIPRISISLCTMPLLGVLLDCLDIHLIVWSSLIKMHVMCHIFKLTFDAFWWRLRSSSGTHPSSSLLRFDLVWHVIFWNHVSLPRYPQLIN